MAQSAEPQVTAPQLQETEAVMQQPETPAPNTQAVAPAGSSPAVVDERISAPTIEEDGPDDLTNEYMTKRQNATVSVESAEMADWVLEKNATAVKPVKPQGDVQGEQLEDPMGLNPFPTDRQPPEQQSMAGQIMRNAAEIPKAALVGVDSAIRNATDWAVGPLVDWLNKNVANLEVEVELPKTGTGKLTQAATQFLTGFVPFLKGMRAIGMTGKVVAPLSAGVLADFATKHPQEARLADLWKEAGLPENVLTDYLAHPAPGLSDLVLGKDMGEESQLEARFKNAVESAFTGVLAEGVVLGARALRAWKSSQAAKIGEEEILRQRYGNLTDEQLAQVVGDTQAPLVQTAAPKAGTKIPRDTRLTPDDAEIEEAFAKQIESDVDAAVDAYSKLPGTRGGKIINTDTARELSEAYLKDRTKSAAVHEPASWLTKEVYQRALQQPPKEGELPMVLMTAGGTGAGKSTAIEGVEQMKSLADQAQIIYDTNMNGLASSKQKIEQALKAGKDVAIVLVARDPVDALVNGALPRAMRQEGTFGSGRTVPVSEHVKTHVESIRTVKALAKEYADDPRVKITVVDNSKGAGKAEVVDLQAVKDLDYNATEAAVLKALEEEKAAGRISEAVYEGFKGKPKPDARAGGPDEGLQGGDRPGAGGQSQPQGNVPGAGQAAAQGKSPAEVAAGKLAASQKAVSESVPSDLTGGYGVVDIGDMKVYVNFARFAGPDDVKAAMADMAERYRNSIVEAQRGTITHKETEQLAQDLGMTVQDLLQRRQGQPLNAEQALAARGLWHSSAESLVQLARKASDPNAGPLDQFAFRKAMALHHAIQAEVIGARTETARALAAWRIEAKGGIEKARAIEQIMSAMGGPEASQAMARRLAMLADANADPAAIAKFVEKGWGAKSFEAIREVWINGLLSAPTTHAVNMASNTLVAFNSILEREVASRIGQLTTEGGGAVAVGESMAMAYGMVTGVKDAFRMAWKGFTTGQSGHAMGKVDLPVEHAVSAEAFGIASDTALGRGVDLLGTAARVPSRMLVAEDEFFKSIGYRMELHAQALRQATSEGLKGPALKERMRQILLDPPENIRIAAADNALYQTFTNTTGDIGQAFIKLRERVPAISFILPFLKTPVNIARYTFERTPLAPLVGQWRDDIAAGGARADLALARMGTGTMIMLAAMDFADSGMVTGKGPKDPGEREAMMRQGWQPYSIRVKVGDSDRFYSYNRADPIGAMLGFAADSAETIRSGEINEDDVDEWQEVMAMGIASVSQVAVNKTYLRGVSEFISLLSDPDRYGESYIKNFVSSFLPYTSLAGAVERAVDPTVRETNNPWEAINAKLAGLSEDLPARRNLWGEPIRAESGLGKAYDFFSPVQSREVKPEPIDTEIMRLAPLAAMDNVAGSAPTRIGKRTGFDGVQVNFKEWPKVYERYVELAGNELKDPVWGLGAKDFLNQVVSGKHDLSEVYNQRKDEMKLVFIKSAITRYRQMAQQAIMADPQFADFAEYVNTLKYYKSQQRLPAGVETERVDVPAVGVPQ